MKHFARLLTIVLACAYFNSLHAQPVNLDFEEPALNSWFPGPSHHYTLTLEHGKAFNGEQYAVLKSTGTPAKNEFGNVMQPFDATPFHGKYVRFSAMLRNLSHKATDAKLWMRIDRPQPVQGFYGKSQSASSNRGGDWKAFDVIGFVDNDAKQIYIGCALEGEGAVAIDGVKFEKLTDAEADLANRSHLPESITVATLAGPSENIRTNDIAQVMESSKSQSVIVLKSGKQLRVSGDYGWLGESLRLQH